MPYVRNPLPNDGSTGGEIQNGRIKRQWFEVRHELHEGISDSFYNGGDVLLFGSPIKEQGNNNWSIANQAEHIESQELLAWLTHICFHLLNIADPSPVPAAEYDVTSDGSSLYSEQYKALLNAWIAANPSRNAFINRIFGFIEVETQQRYGRILNINQFLNAP